MLGFDWAKNSDASTKRKSNDLYNNEERLVLCATCIYATITTGNGSALTVNIKKADTIKKNLWRMLLSMFVYTNERPPFRLLCKTANVANLGHNVTNEWVRESQREKMIGTEGARERSKHFPFVIIVTISCNTYQGISCVCQKTLLWLMYKYRIKRAGCMFTVNATHANIFAAVVTNADARQWENFLQLATISSLQKPFVNIKYSMVEKEADETVFKQSQSFGANSCKVIRNKQLYLDKILWHIEFICVVITKRSMDKTQIFGQLISYS